VVNFTLQPLYSRRKDPQYAFNRRLGGPGSRFGLSKYEKKNYFHLLKVELWIVQLIF
jgi:hypothetical protein